MKTTYQPELIGYDAQELADLLVACDFTDAGEWWIEVVSPSVMTLHLDDAVLTYDLSSGTVTDQRLDN